KTEILSNDSMVVKVSSWGGGIVGIQLTKYRQTLDRESGSVEFDFSECPALSITGIPDLSTNNDFEVSINDSNDALHVSRTTGNGIGFERIIRFSGEYTLNVEDTFSNGTDQPMMLSDKNGLVIGPMNIRASVTATREKISYLGLDTKAAGSGMDVVYWANKGSPGNEKSLAKRFTVEGMNGIAGCIRRAPLSKPLPRMIEIPNSGDTDWIAAKNKFFVQILAPENGGDGFVLRAMREIPESETLNDPATWNHAVTLQSVWGEMIFKDRVLPPGGSVTRRATYYVGPKKLALLKQLGNQQDEVMFRAWKGWGWFRVLCEWLLWTLNAIYSVIPNYGLAIILLTLIVKIVFWPVTHKSTESMKKMQKIQPLVTEIKQKYKDKPQKMNQEVMALYKEHKVNPMAGCLPMLVQIPVFIALFTVLRSAIELRFAPFLWIADLSEPEGLFPGLPIIRSINILPVLMTATMVWQQKLTPTAGDPQQQKMMAFMPVFMLFIFYHMASALVLYWTTSQCLSIVQLLMQKRKNAPTLVEPSAQEK
ncbi:MAG: membrane protein insertase YidC, partial [Lentisphaerae bacterium]|nr:membrane protein insertase YidC [Lentisphaerota bacterium]